MDGISDILSIKAKLGAPIDWRQQQAVESYPQPQSGGLFIINDNSRNSMMKIQTIMLVILIVLLTIIAFK